MGLTQPTTISASSAPTARRSGLRARVSALVSVAVIAAGMGFVSAPAVAADAPSTDATLSRLTITAGTKSPAFFPKFTPSWNAYSVAVPATVLAITCTPIANDPGAIVVVTPACSTVKFKKAVYATKVLTFTVTAADGVTKFAYKVTVVHNSPVNAKALLKSVSAKGYKYAPKFNATKAQFYTITTKPAAKAVTVAAKGLGKVKATVVKPKTWAPRGLNFIRVKTAAGKSVGDYTVAVLVPAYPTVTQGAVKDLAGGFSADLNIVNGTLNAAATTAKLDAGQAQGCYDLGDPAVAIPPAVGTVHTVFVTNVASSCKVTLSAAVTPALNFLPSAPSVVKRTVLNQVSWSLVTPAPTLDGFTADFTVTNAQVTCTIAGSTKNYCTSSVADAFGMREGKVNLTGRQRNTEQTVTVTFIPDPGAATKASETITVRTLKDYAGLTVDPTVTTRPSGFSVPVTLKPGTVVDATVALAVPTPECVSKSRPRLRVEGSSNQVSSLRLTSTDADVATTVYATGVFKNCFATISMSVRGNTGYATPATASEQIKTVNGIGGEALASFAYTVDRTTDGFIATYDTFGGTIACPTVANGALANRIAIACDDVAETVTVTGALPGETVTLSVTFNTDKDFTPPAGPLTIVGQAKFGTSTLNVNLDSLSKQAEGFRFNITSVKCTPVATVDAYSTVDEPLVSISNGVVTVSNMKLDPTDPGADRTATIKMDCLPQAGYDAPESQFVDGITAPFGGVYNRLSPRLEVDTGDSFTKVPGAMTVYSDITDWVFPPTSSLALTYRWERSLKTDPTQICTNFGTIPDWTDVFYFAQPLASDTCVRVWVTPTLTNQDGSTTVGDPVVTNNVPVEVTPAYQNTNPLPQLAGPDDGLFVGSPVTVSPGYWNGRAGGVLSYQWQSCTVAGSADIAAAQLGVVNPPVRTDCTGKWVDIDAVANPTAESDTLYLSETEIGAVIRAVVTLTNDLGSASKASVTLAVPATTAALENAVAETPTTTGTPTIAPQWNNTVQLGRPLIVNGSATWLHASGLFVDWEWQYRDPADLTGEWVAGEVYVDAQGKEFPHVYGATSLPGDYRAVEFLVDVDGSPIFDVNGNRIEVYSNVINVPAPVLGG